MRGKANNTLRQATPRKINTAGFTNSLINFEMLGSVKVNASNSGNEVGLTWHAPEEFFKKYHDAQVVLNPERAMSVFSNETEFLFGYRQPFQLYDQFSLLTRLPKISENDEYLLKAYFSILFSARKLPRSKFPSGIYPGGDVYGEKLDLASNREVTRLKPSDGAWYWGLSNDDSFELLKRLINEGEQRSVSRGLAVSIIGNLKTALDDFKFIYNNSPDEAFARAMWHGKLNLSHRPFILATSSASEAELVAKEFPKQVKELAKVTDDPWWIELNKTAKNAVKVSDQLPSIDDKFDWSYEMNSLKTRCLFK